MASSSDKSFKQDLVVSIRYRNDLPPPPMPPKFLDIDTGGLAQYLTTSYASSLARREVPNIDADAEGGMPIDMVGIPGYFLGDESAIMAPEVLPILDPADQALMLTADQLRTQGGRNNVSFLRKTQYMTSQNASAHNPLSRPTPRKRQSISNNTPTAYDREDKENIKRNIQKGFDIAYPESIPYNPPDTRSQPSTQSERDAWRHPVHPANPRLKPVSYHPILPDLESGVDGGWYRFKFEKPPLPPHAGKRDPRIDSGIFFTVPDRASEAEWQAKLDAYEKDPQAYDHPGAQPHKFSLHVPKNQDDVKKIKKHMFIGHPDADDPALLAGVTEETEDGMQRIPFERTRVYPQVQQATMDPRRFMALGLYDPSSTKNAIPPTEGKRRQGTAAYYYPIIENVRLKADRKIADFGKEEAEDLADVIFAAPTESSAQQAYMRAEFRGKYDKAFEADYARLEERMKEEEKADLEKWEAEQREARGDEMEDVHANGDANGDANGHKERAGEGAGSGESPLPADDDADADGMEDD